MRSAGRKHIECGLCPARAEDAKALAEVEKACFSTPLTELSLRRQLKTGFLKAVIAKIDGTVIGYAGLQQAADEGYIANIAVLPEWRHRGCGEALVRWLIDYAQKSNLSFLTLEVRRSNTAAQALYRKLGFEVVGERLHYYARPKEDAILMTLFLKKR
jgi:ribosomal-protein-alanine N-acetyltransferase